jgi:hypothetical protein
MDETASIGSNCRLFPIPESRGMNYSAQPLQEHEAQVGVQTSLISFQYEEETFI